jgi:hypothetical protein
MSNQTMQRSATKRRATAKAQSRTGSFNRQTARLEGRRDGKPLIQVGPFEWGTHLTRAQKARIQRRAAFSFFGVAIAAVVGVFIFGLIQQNILIPNQAVVSINGTKISQDQYRRFLAYTAQDTWNRIQSELKQQGQLLPKVQAGDKAATTQNTILTQEIQTNESSYRQAQITQTAIQQLIEDQLIRQGEKQFPTAKIEPSAQDITSKVNAFKAAFPNSETYAQFLQKDNLSDSDIRAAVAVQIRRDNLQAYLVSQLVSPTRQLHLRSIQTNDKATAQADYAALLKDPSDANWSKLAKQHSLDVSTKNVGGDLGFVPHGTGDAAIDYWAYDSSRKVNDIGLIIPDSTGTYDVVQVIGVDPSRVVDSTTLKAAQNNALSHWLSAQQVAKTSHVTTADQTMLTATRNMPLLPDLNATLPNENPSPATTTGGP